MIYFIKNKKYFIYLFLIVFFLLQLFFSLKDSLVWWDASVYIGMGKYLASGGSLGLWEMFRPPLLPIIYSIFYILHIPLIIAGKVFVITASTGLIFLVYLISESIKENSGIFSAIILTITPIFFFFAKIPYTDIVSVFFLMLSIFLYSKNKNFLMGISISIAFLFRFPQGLIIIAVAIVVLIDTYDRNKMKWLKDYFVKGFIIGLGFFILVLPYFLLNYIFYGGFFNPLTTGSGIVSSTGSLYLYNLGLFFYTKELWVIAPFLYLSILSPFVFFNKRIYKKYEEKKNLRFILVTSIVFMTYFFWQSHKELRYSLAFIPYLAILSGVSFSYILSLIKNKKIVMIVLIFIILVVVLKVIPYSYFKYQTNESYITLNNYSSTLIGTFLSTTPLPVAFGKVKLLTLFYSADGFKQLYDENLNKIDGIILNSCDIFCPDKTKDINCDKDLLSIKNEINHSPFKKNYEILINKCTYSIYKK